MFITEVLSKAVIATMTPNLGKKILIQELNPNFFVKAFGTVTATAVMEMLLWGQQGLDSQWRFHSNLDSFSLVSQIISRGEPLTEKINLLTLGSKECVIWLEALHKYSSAQFCLVSDELNIALLLYTSPSLISYVRCPSMKCLYQTL